MAYWLLKSEPDAFGLDDLVSRPKKREPWDGIRNYQARNFIRDEMKKGDEAFFYHSNCAEPGIVGIVKIVKEAYVDHTAFDPNEKYYDAKSDPENPRWFMVDVQYRRRMKRNVSLAEMKANPALEGFALLRKGNRLSVLPVEEQYWNEVLAMEQNGEAGK